MNKKKWGPIYWYIIHTVSASLIENNNNIENNNKIENNNNIENIKKFYILLPHILPCSICSLHTVSYIKKDSPLLCNNKVSLLRWTLRFHNDTNTILSKKTYIYNILIKYSNFLNHKKLFYFIDILNELKDILTENYRNVYYKEVINLLQKILPCTVCCNNMKLIKNNIYDNFLNLMYSHFPNNNSKQVYKYTGFKCNKYLLDISTLITSKYIEKGSVLYKYFPVSSHSSYYINFIATFECPNIQIYAILNNKLILLLIKNNKYNRYKLDSGKLEKIILTINNIREGLICFTILFNDNCNNFCLDKININNML
jgi:hypothetical protein